jgi:proteasome alpha subunit
LDAQINEITYSEKIQVQTLVKRICDFKQTYTQYGGVRPFGTALLIAGVDQTGARLFSTDPSGALMEYKAASEGAGRTGAMAYFEEHYKENVSMEEAIDLGIKALHKGTEGKLNPEAIEIGVVKKGVAFHILSVPETKTYVTKAIGGK